jgi:hypothetical protein
MAAAEFPVTGMLRFICSTRTVSAGRVKEQRDVPVNPADTIMPGNNLLYIQQENNTYAL